MLAYSNFVLYKLISESLSLYNIKTTVIGVFITMEYRRLGNRWKTSAVCALNVNRNACGWYKGYLSKSVSMYLVLLFEQIAFDLWVMKVHVGCRRAIHFNDSRFFNTFHLWLLLTNDHVTHVLWALASEEGQMSFLLIPFWTILCLNENEICNQLLCLNNNIHLDWPTVLNRRNA